MKTSRMSRRLFLKGALIGGVGVAATGMVGCTPQQPGNSAAEGAVESSSDAVSEGWLGAPLDASTLEIKETVDADVVIAGAGVAGITAALTAVEEGAKTVLIEKGEDVSTRAHWLGAINSKLYEEAGIHYGEQDRADIVNDLMWHASYRADQRLIQLWFDKSGEAMDWYTERCESDGTMKVLIETDTKDTGGRHMSICQAHVPALTPTSEMGPNETGLKYSNTILLNMAINQGLEFRNLQTAVQLVQSEDGTVTGIIATDADGNYIQYNASKGVILCTGGYVGNEQMCKALNPAQFVTSNRSSANTGEGIKMGLWAGGLMSDLHWWMDNDRGMVVSGKIWRAGSQPWLRTDCYGNRFCNEDVPYDYGTYAGSLLPGHRWWCLFDDSYWNDLESFGTTICSRMFPKPGAINSEQVCHSKEEFREVYIDPFIESGDMVQADSIEELVEKMKSIDDRAELDTFKATIDRYNELCAKGVDEDFGKLPFRMGEVSTPPFYAVCVTGVSICNLDGLRVNENIEVIDENGKAIPGLYAAGNDQGGFFGMSYPWYYGGTCAGKAMTFARIAAKNAASK